MQRTCPYLLTDRCAMKSSLGPSDHFAALVDKDGVFLSVSEATAQRIGKTAAAIIGKNERELFPPEIAEKHLITAKLAISSATQQVIQETIQTPTGPLELRTYYTPLIHAETEKPCVLIHAENIQRETLLRSDLKEKENLYKLLFENTQECMALHEIITDASGRPSDYRFVEVNHAFERATGLLRNNILGKTVLEVLPDTPETLIQQYGRVALGGGAVSFVHCNTKWNRYFDITAFSPKPRHFVATFKDITNQVNAEQDKARLLSQMLHNEKLASIGTLAASIVHEVNNPLTAIKGYLAILQQLSSTSPNPERTSKAVESIDKAINRITEIVNGLRIYSRKASASENQVELHQAISDTVVLFKPNLKEHGIALQAELNAKNTFINTAEGRIQQILMNLISNARDALTNTAGDKIVRICTSDTPQGLTLTLTDNGCGIAEDVLPNIFKPFFTTKDALHGTGLGLSIIQSLLREIGAEISVSSQLGKGTTFSILFATEEGKLKSTATTPQKPGAQGIALVVDDMEEITDVLRAQLKQLGYNVDISNSPQKALDLLAIKPYDVIISDLNMPEIAGESLLLKAHGLPLQSRACLIAMTGESTLSRSPEAQDIIQRVSHAILIKPFDDEHLEKAIAAAKKRVT